MRRGTAVLLLCLLVLLLPAQSKEYKIKTDFWKSVKLEPHDIDPSWNDTLTVVGSEQATKGEGRIAYGTVASIGQFPFMARLAVIGPKTYSMCGGTVIGPYHVLTAAHCLFSDGVFTPPTHVLIGGVDISSYSNFPEQLPVAQALYPAQYQIGKVDSNYDVAVLRLSKATTAPKVTLSTTAPSPGTAIVSMGWGKTEAGTNTDPRLKYATLNVGTLGVSPCSLAGCYGQIPCTIECEVGIPAGSGFTSACQGDSGGPQFLAGTTTQVSVVSFGPSNCGKDAYGYSTLVNTVSTYIQSVLDSSPTPTPTSTPSPTPTPTPSPTVTPSPTPTVTPSPTPTPTFTPFPTPTPTSTPFPTPTPTSTPSGCSMDARKGVIVSIRATSSSPCTVAVTRAIALASGDVSGTYQFCYWSKCSRSGTSLSFKVKLIVDNSRTTAKSKIIASFGNGQFYSRFKARFGSSYRYYKLKTGGACVFPGYNCYY